MNKSIIYLITTFLVFSCASINIEDKVISKLKQDDKSIEVYKSLCDRLKIKNDSSSSYDLYLSLYNKGIPLVRLFEYETIEKSYSGLICNEENLNKDFLNLISNKLNYINDERRDSYFHEFINKYYIVPPSD